MSAACVVEMSESFAQNGEDIILWRALGNIENGTYIDVGTADPYDDSITKASTNADGTDSTSNLRTTTQYVSPQRDRAILSSRRAPAAGRARSSYTKCPTPACDPFMRRIDRP